MECAYHFRVEMGLLCLWIRRAHSTMKTKETLVFQNAAENIWKLKFFKRIGMKRKVVHNGKRAYVECLTVDHGFCVKCYLYRTSIEFISMQTV